MWKSIVLSGIWTVVFHSQKKASHKRTDAAAAIAHLAVRHDLETPLANVNGEGEEILGGARALLRPLVLYRFLGCEELMFLLL